MVCLELLSFYRVVLLLMLSVMGPLIPIRLNWKVSLFTQTPALVQYFRKEKKKRHHIFNFNNPIGNSQQFNQSVDLLSFKYPNRRTWCLNNVPSFFLSFSCCLVPFGSELKFLIRLQVTNRVAQRSRSARQEPQIRFEQEGHAPYSRRYLQR